MTPQARQNVLSEAIGWLGTPYHHHGAIKGSGVDCANLLIEVFSRQGLIPRVDPGDYAPEWHLHRNEEIFLGWIRRYAVPTDAPEPGDVGMWKFGRCWSHGSILIEPQVVIHAYVGRGVIRTRIDEVPLADRKVCWWTLEV